jgi:hypothetical protein
MPEHDETRPPSAMARIDDDEDVEGHSLRRAVEPDGVTSRRIDDDEDVEGHRGMSSRADGGPDDFGQARVNRTRVDGDDDDVEGHYGQLKSPASRGE